MTRRASLLLVLLLSAVAFSSTHAQSQCSQCGTLLVPDTDDGISAFFGVSHVDVYLNDDARNADPAVLDSAAIINGFTAWATGCMGMPGIPTFTLQPGPPPANRDERTTVLIDYRPTARALAHPTNPQADINAQTSGTNITLFGLCSKQKGNCDGNNRFNWTSAHGKNTIVHEFGHTLGLGHDSGSCSNPGLMSEFGSPGQTLALLSEYCDLASRVNDPNQACGLDAMRRAVHPCQLCQRMVGGEVIGLVQGESVSLKLDVLTNSGEYRAAVNGPGSFEFPGEVPEGFSYRVTVSGVSNPAKTCTVQNDSGTVGSTDINNVKVDCVCPASPSPLVTGPSGTAQAAVSTSCDDPERGKLFELNPDNQVVFATCRDYPFLCSGSGSALDPWWWTGPAPTGDDPCQRQTNCTSRTECVILSPITGDLYCFEQLDCEDACSPASRVSFSGPRLMVAGLADGSTVTDSLHLEGFVEDLDGLSGVDFFLDGVKLAPSAFEMGMHHPDACAGVQRDCDPMSGFVVEFDASGWTAGAHRLDVVAIDGRPLYSMGTRIHRTFTVDNACSSAAPPAASISSPSAGAVLEGTVTVSVTASAEEGVREVRFFLDGARVSTDFTSPYQWTWDTTTVSDGAHTLHVQVVDRCGGVDNSATVAVETANANELPRMELEVPTGGVTVGGTAVEVSGWAYDEDGATNVQLRIDGSPAIGATATSTRPRPEICSAEGEADPNCPDVGWVLSFDSTRYPDGPHLLQVVVTDSRGAVVTRSRTVTISNQLPAPPGVNPPTAKTVVEGNSVSFAVAVTSGAGPFNYWWQYRSGSRWLNLFDGDRGGRVTGAYTPQLTISGVGFADAGGYRCRVWNDGGVTESGSASLTVVESLDAPTVTAGIDQSVTEGETAELRVTAQGVGPLSYQWQRLQGSIYTNVVNGTGISGATSAVLRISGATEANAGRYRCLVSNAGGTTPSADVRLTVYPDLSGSCVEGPNTICLHQNRFKAEVVINGSPGQSKPFSDLGGLFTLGNHANVEVAVKLLDGTAINGRHWLFHGSLTSLPYTLTVTDTVTGTARVYQKPSGSFCGGADTAAFADPDPATGAFMVGSLLALPADSGTGSCLSGTTALCLLDSRFEVKVLRGGLAQRAVPVSSLSGAYTFGSSANPEVVVKVLDGTVVNDWYWVFFGSLTSQDYTVQVTDTTTGAVKSYPSPGTSCGQADTSAF